MIKSAEEETRKKTEKSNEIKKINTQIMVLKSEITKMEDTLKEFKLYKKFLDKVTPQVFLKMIFFLFISLNLKLFQRL